MREPDTTPHATEGRTSVPARSKPMNHRILNLGAGTQSSVLLVMCDRRLIEPVEVAVFADTQDEPAEVYDHLNWLERQVKTPIVRIKSGNIVEESLVYQRSHDGIEGRFASLPLHTPTGMQPRQCTKYFKVIPILRFIRREILGLGVRDPVPNGTNITQLFGISFDERGRMAPSGAKYRRHEYPFVDRRWRRQRVIELAEEWLSRPSVPPVGVQTMPVPERRRVAGIVTGRVC